MRAGRVLGVSISTWARRIVPLTLLSIACHLPWLMLRFAEAGGSFLRTDPTVEFLFITSGIAFSWFACGAIAHAVVKPLRGGEAGFLESLGTAGRKVLTILGLSVLFVILEAATGIASLFLAGILLGGWHAQITVVLGWAWFVFAFLVPLAMVLAMFWLAVPAAVVEGVGVGGALRRSRELLRGSFGAAVRLSVLVIVAWVGVWLFVPAWWWGFGGSYGRAWFLPSMVLEAVVIAPLVGVASAVSYHDRRAATEGASSEVLERVFE